MSGRYTVRPLSDRSRPNPRGREGSRFTANWSNTSNQSAWRVASRLHHPDVGGDPSMWQQLDEAKRLLEKSGMW